jgi:GT2 family glycosyltransferase
MADSFDAADGGDNDPDDEPDLASAPTVVAVVVACDPGPWFEECLAALGAQDYPHLSTLVIDAGQADVTARVAAVAPGAYVRRIAEDGRRRSFGEAANDVLAVVEGASHFVLCHDDVAPEPDAVRLLLEEAFRSNAAVVGPKLVEWDDPTHLLQVGLSPDKGGVLTSGVEPGELDQEQHDAVRDVFCIPGGLTLVRADIFTTIGGFDPTLSPLGEDLDLCWRAQIAGGRVLVAPSARVRHVEAMTRGLRPEQDPVDLRALQARHRVRIVLKNYSLFHLLRVLPQLAVLTLGEAAYALVTGRRHVARANIGAWTANLRHIGELRAARQQVRSYRAWPDSEVRRLQAPGSARVTRALRGQFSRRERGRIIDGRAWSTSWPAARLPLAAAAAVVVVLLFGSRHLLGGAMPSVGELAPLTGPVELARLFLSGWRTSGLGAHAPAPPAFALLSAAGSLLLGGTGLLQKLLVLGAFPVGLFGVYRLTRPLGLTNARIVGLIAYAAVPLPYDALARGRWGGLVAYATAPWILGALARATGRAPFGVDDDQRRDSDGLGAPWTRAVGLAMLLAVAGSVAPSIIVVTLVAGIGLALGSAVAGGGGGRAFTRAAWAAGVAFVLLVPWSLDLVLPGSGTDRITGLALASGRAPGLGALLRFHTGPLGAGPIGWAFLVAGALAVLVGHDWRLQWATRCWGVAMACWLFAWAGGRGWLPIPAPAPEVTLAPAAVAMALAAALGLVAFRTDLRAYQFGWRQGASLAAAAAVTLATLPILAASLDGRWNLPSRDYRSEFSWMPDHQREGAFRVLWLGDPEALPLHGWSLGNGMAYGLSDGGPPDVTALWPASDDGATGLVADAVRVARKGELTRLGRTLAPMAVRYIVVVDRAAPSTSASRLGTLPPDIISALAAQLDLKLLNSDPDEVVYENAAWGPGRSRLPASVDAGGAVQPGDVAGGKAVLPTAQSPLHFSGRLTAGDEVFFSQAASDGWSLKVAGRSSVRRRGLGWANAYTVRGTGNATLEYHTSPVRYIEVGIEVLLWAAAIRALVGRRRRRAGTAAVVDVAS